MKTSFLIGCVLAACALAAPTVSRDALNPLEKSLERSLSNAQMEILGLPRGLYLSGIGAVVTADVNLTYTPTINPFRLTIGKEQVAAIHAKKMSQLPVLREIMRQTMLESGSGLDAVPKNELIVLGVTLENDTWEKTSGLPGRIVMRAVRSALIEAKSGHAKPDQVIGVEEL